MSRIEAILELLSSEELDDLVAIRLKQEYEDMCYLHSNSLFLDEDMYEELLESIKTAHNWFSAEKL